MILCLLASLFLLCIVGSMFWREKGGMCGIIACFILWAIAAVIAVFSKGIMYTIAFGLSFTCSVLLSFQFKFLLLKTKFGKKWVNIDHQGTGCMTLLITFICLMSLFMEIVRALLLK